MSRPESIVVRVSLYSVEPPPAPLCLSWSLAEIFSYLSNIARVWILNEESRFPILAARWATVPVDGHTTWYMSCDAYTRTSGPFGLLSMTPSRWVSTDLFYFLRHPYSSISDAGYGKAHSWRGSQVSFVCWCLQPVGEQITPQDHMPCHWFGLLLGRISFVATFLEMGVWHPSGSDAENCSLMSIPMSNASCTFTFASATWPLMIWYSALLLLVKGWQLSCNTLSIWIRPSATNNDTSLLLCACKTYENVLPLYSPSIDLERFAQMPKDCIYRATCSEFVDIRFMPPDHFSVLMHVCPPYISILTAAAQSEWRHTWLPAKKSDLMVAGRCCMSSKCQVIHLA